MRAGLKLLILSLLVAFSVMVLEQLCYRFSEAYAIWRADWVWREHDSKGIAVSVLRHLPLSQWANPPAGNDVMSGGDAKGESLYAERILSYTRPLRDDLYEHSQLGDMHEFEVREIGGIKDMALPRLTVSATSVDVSEGKARRVGEKLPMTKAILLHVLPLKEDFGKSELSDQRRKREGQFVSFLDRGIGCGIIHVSSSDELLDAVGKLREEEKRLATKVLAWGKGKSAS